MTIPEYPITREEMYLDAIARGGGGGVTVTPLSATENGTYTAPSGTAYSPVTVNVPAPTPTLIPKTVTANGTYDPADDSADGYSSVAVIVPTGDADLMKQNVQGSLQEYADESVTHVRASAFEYAGIKRVWLPNVTGTLGNNAFSGAGLTYPLFLPKARAGSKSLYSCGAPVIVIGGWEGWAHQPTANNPNLEIMDVAGAVTVKSNQFATCNKLATLILRQSAVAPAEATIETDVFKAGGTGGTVYIPQSLYAHLGDGTADDYKAATNWSLMDARGTVTWAPIEGSVYESAYADGTPIV